MDTNNTTRLADLPDVLNVAQVAAYLNIGTNSAYELLRSGAIRSIKIGKQFRVPKRCLEKFLEAA